MRRSSRILLCLATSILVASCAAPTTIGPKAAQLRPGVTTIDEAIASMGPPKSKSSAGTGVLLQWMETNVGFAVANGAHVAILFDASGKMVKITHEYRSDPQK